MTKFIHRVRSPQTSTGPSLITPLRVAARGRPGAKARAGCLALATMSFVVLAPPLVAEAKNAVPLGEAVTSSVEGLPVPSIATLDTRKTAYDNLGGTTVLYRIPTTIKKSAVLAWYNERLPMGEAFNGWQWCEKSVSSTSVQRIWHHPGTNEMLSLTLSFGNKPKYGNGILLGLDDLYPC